MIVSPGSLAGPYATYFVHEFGIHTLQCVDNSGGYTEVDSDIAWAYPFDHTLPFPWDMRQKTITRTPGFPTLKLKYTNTDAAGTPNYRLEIWTIDIAGGDIKKIVSLPDTGVQIFSDVKLAYGLKAKLFVHHADVEVELGHPCRLFWR